MSDQVDQSSRRTYRQSEINMYLKCGKQWEYRYVYGLVIPPKAALTLGCAVDVAVTHNFTQKVQTKTDVSADEMLDAFSTEFDQRAPGTDFDGEDVGELKDVGAQLVRLHAEQVSPGVQPETVQEQFTLETDADYNLTGTLDLTDSEGFIRDTKTAKRKYDADAISRAIQPAMYDFAYESLRGHKASGFIYDVLEKPKVTLPARYQKVEGEVTLDDRLWLFGAIYNMHKGIKAGVALPAADGAWWCSKSWCGYWSICKGKQS